MLIQSGKKNCHRYFSAKNDELRSSQRLRGFSSLEIENERAALGPNIAEARCSKLSLSFGKHHKMITEMLCYQIARLNYDVNFSTTKRLIILKL